MEALHALMAPQTEQARKQSVQGLVTAKIHDREDDGTYRLIYLTMGESGTPSAPARVMMPMAGGKRGTYFFPEVGDEVVVAFEQGDTNFPIILGAVWNRDDPVPQQAQASSENNIRTIVSRSGHELTFDDTTGTQQVKIATQGGHSFVLDDTPPGTVTLTSSTGMSVTMDATSISMTIKATMTQVLLNALGITLTTPNLVSITAASGITVQSSGPIALTGAAGIVLKGAMTTLPVP